MLGRFDAARLRSVVLAAVLLGALAGLSSALLLTATGEPSLSQAITLERERADAEAKTASGGERAADEHEAVSRSVQRGPGLFGAYALTGATFGVLLAVVYTSLRRGQDDPFWRAITAGCVLAGAITVAPWLKYPPNPPGVGDPSTLDHRQALYVGVMVLAALVGVAALLLSSRLRLDGWMTHRRVVAVLAVVVVPMAVAFALLPPPPDATDVPATLLWRFRLASLGGNLLLWTVLSVGLGVLAAEAAARKRLDQNSMPFMAATPES